MVYNIIKMRIKGKDKMSDLENPTDQDDDDVIEERSIEEFRETGLLLLTNQFLHIFGWALTVDIDEDGKVTKFYPAYCKFRGFDSDLTSKAYEKVTKHLEKRMPELLRDVKEK